MCVPSTCEASELCSCAETFAISLFDDLSVYIPSEEKIFFMIQAADEFRKNNHKPTPFHANVLYRHARTLFDELQVRHLEQEKEKCPTFELILFKKIRQTKINLHSIIFLFISTMHLFENNAKEKPKKKEGKL